MNKEVPLSDIYHNLVIEIMELPENTREENLTRCREMLIRHGFTMEDCIAIEEKIRKPNFRDEVRQAIHKILS